MVTSTDGPSCVLLGVVATATNMSIQGNLRVTKLKTKSLFHYNDLSRRKRVVLVFVCFIFPNYDSITGKLLITTGTKVSGLSVRNIIAFLLIFSCVIFKNIMTCCTAILNTASCYYIKLIVFIKLSGLVLVCTTLYALGWH